MVTDCLWLNVVAVQPGADLLRNPASFACKLPNSNPVLVFFTVCTAECADLPELLLNVTVHTYGANSNEQVSIH